LKTIKIKKKHIFTSLLSFFPSFFFFLLLFVPSTIVSQTKTKPKIKEGKGQGILGDGVMIGNGIRHNNVVVIG
jgi:hypothetical protein